MRLRRVAAIAALLSVVFTPAAAQAGSCWHPKEAQAAQIRALHLMLMVGTLQCRGRNPELTELFNDFVRYQDRVLVANNEVLKGRFMRESGAAGWEADYDTFSTSLANLYSGRLDDGGFCELVERTAWDASDAGYTRLLRLSESVADAPVSGPCEARTHYAPHRSPKIAISDALRRPAPPPVAAVAVAVEQVQAVETAPEAPVVVVEAEAVADVPEAQAAAPAEVVAAAVVTEVAPAVEAAPAAEAAAPSRDEVLRAAVAALQSAAAALQAVSAPAGADRP